MGKDITDVKRDIAEYLTSGLSDFDCFVTYAPRGLTDHEVFGRREAIERLVKTSSLKGLQAKRDAKMASNARGQLETYRAMTADGGYAAEFQAYSWYHADEQAAAAGYEVVDWTTGMQDENVLVIKE